MVGTSFKSQKSVNVGQNISQVAKDLPSAGPSNRATTAASLSTVAGAPRQAGVVGAVRLPAMVAARPVLGGAAAVARHLPFRPLSMSASKAAAATARPASAGIKTPPAGKNVPADQSSEATISDARSSLAAFVPVRSQPTMPSATAAGGTRTPTSRVGEGSSLSGATSPSGDRGTKLYPSSAAAVAAAEAKSSPAVVSTRPPAVSASLASLPITSSRPPVAPATRLPLSAATKSEATRIAANKSPPLEADKGNILTTVLRPPVDQNAALVVSSSSSAVSPAPSSTSSPSAANPATSATKASTAASQTAAISATAGPFRAAAAAGISTSGNIPTANEASNISKKAASTFLAASTPATVSTAQPASTSATLICKTASTFVKTGTKAAANSSEASWGDGRQPALPAHLSSAESPRVATKDYPTSITATAAFPSARVIQAAAASSASASTASSYRPASEAVASRSAATASQSSATCPPVPASASNSEESRKRRLCPFYGSAAKCQKGNGCRDIHDLKSVKCWHYERGHCGYGSRCYKRHDL